MMNKILVISLCVTLFVLPFSSNAKTLSSIFVLEVSIDPSSVIMDVNQSQTFTSTVLGDSPPYSYQWYLDDMPIPDAINSTYIFTPSSAGVYMIYLNVTDSASITVKSNVAQVTVNPPLSVSISPSSVVMNVKESQLFNSSVSGGTSPYSYQWYLNGAVVPGATWPNWTFTPASSGSYTVYVNVTDSVGAEAKSNIASVRVPKLLISMTTDRPIYKLPYTPPITVNIGGNLTLDGVPVSDGLVALTVIQSSKKDPYIRPVLFRTLSIGVLPSQNWSFNIVALQVGEINESGAFVPKTVFPRPSTALERGPVFNITVTNVSYKPVVYLTLTLFDADLVPITTVITILQPVPANSTFSIITDSIPLGDWVALGNATAYVSAFDNVPPYIYFPYCPEASVQFEVVSNGESGFSVQNDFISFGEQTIFSVNGNYNLTFRIHYKMALPIYSAWGNYTVKVSSRYQSQQAINSYVFWVRIPGDANGDGIVNIADVNIVSSNWMQRVPTADPAADLNGDGIVNIIDANLVGSYWMKREQF